MLSAIARLSGGTYEPLQAIAAKWRKNRGPFARLDDPLPKPALEAITKEYLTPALRCGMPASVDDQRLMLKALSNDQTGFTGFTSLVDTSSGNIGYDGPVRLLASAAFAEPFALAQLDTQEQRRILSLTERLRTLSSSDAEEIEDLLVEAERICPIAPGRTKGKSPIFFYSVSDRKFGLPAGLYDRLVEATGVAYRALRDAARAEGPQPRGRLALTGSVDFMVADGRAYLIDIGFPAVGYIADILAASAAAGEEPETGIEAIVDSLPGRVSIPLSEKARELGFFKQERDYLIEAIRRSGREVMEPAGADEAIVAGEALPDKAFDYVTRNQPVRNRILAGVTGELAELGVETPRSIVSRIDEMEFARFARQSLGAEFGLVVKKRVLFLEYDKGSSYYKPLVVPLWSREIASNGARSTLFEEFVPSLIPVDVIGDRAGSRCYEIRLYFSETAR